MSAPPSPTSYPPGYLEAYSGNQVIAVCSTFIVLETLCICLRFYARRLSRVTWGWDDNLIIGGWVFCIGICGTSLGDVAFGGVGYHEARVLMDNPETLVTWAKFLVVNPLVYLPAVTLPKLAMLAIYLRVFTHRPYRIACYVLGGVLTASWLANTIVGFIDCIPLAYLWDKTIPGGRCIDTNSWFIWASLVNIITDVAMLLLPLPSVWQMHTSTNVKIGLTVTFATGGVGLVSSIIRFVGFFDTNAELDGTWSAVPLLTWTCVEPGTYLIAACLPTYRPLARLFRTQLSRASNTGNSASGFSRSGGVQMDSIPKSGFERLQDPYGRSEAQIFGETLDDKDESLPPSRVMVRRDIDVTSSSY